MTTIRIGPRTKKKAWPCGATILRKVAQVCTVHQRNWKSEQCDALKSNCIADALKSNYIVDALKSSDMGKH